MSIQVVSEGYPYLKSLNSKARDSSISQNDLVTVHKKIGDLLGQTYLNKRGITEKTITTVQGKESKSPVINLGNITIIVLLRAGLYVAEGVRELLEDVEHSYLLSQSPDDIDLNFIRDRDVIIVDSVINTGTTIMRYISNINEARSLSVMSIVLQNDFAKFAEKEYKFVDFIVSRISDNSFVGKGKTDTGNRLFGTIKG